ncbi:MAG: EAL domain-containing protein [Abditibacteriota bacterium]|nr:EAL domain-containing protein [Abditibacteriota bacterium]
MDLIIVCAAALVVCIALLLCSIQFMDISFRADRPVGKLISRTALRRVYDEFNTSDYETTPGLYINIFSNRLQTESTYEQISKVNEYLETAVKRALDSGGFLGACITDSHNFVMLAGRKNRDLSRFAESFVASGKDKNELQRLINLLDIHMGQHNPTNTDTSFDDAVDKARKASLYARNANIRYAAARGELLENIQDSEQMKQNLENFIDTNRFFTVLQPYVTTDENRVAGAETLTRLRLSPQDPAALPGRFLMAVNSEHLYEKFDFYVFTKCCEWIFCRQDRYVELPPISVNFSRITLSAGNFTERFFEEIKRFNIKPSQLIIEINEEVPETSMEIMIRNINTLYDAGFPVYLDDFGIGTTSISDLKRMKISVVKMDKSFVHELGDEKNRVIFKSLIDLAHSLNMKVLCEGIENEEQKKFCEDNGVDIIQGFYFYKPISVEEYDTVLEREMEPALPAGIARE